MLLGRDGISVPAPTKSVYGVSSVACSEDISVCVPGVFLVVLMFVVRISVSVYLVCF